jgi:hypothetical protein
MSCAVIEFPVQQLSAEWFAIREAPYVFTASKIAEAVGLSGFATPASYYDTRLNPHLYEKMEDNAFMLAGREAEPKIAARVATLLSCELAEVGTFQNESCSWIFASPDRKILTGMYAGLFLEIKHGVYKLYTQPKIEHLVQCHVQMFCTNKKRMLLAYGFEEQLCIFCVEFSMPFWTYIFLRVERFRELLMEKKSWQNEWPNSYYATEHMWKTGKLDPDWYVTCKCQMYHDNPLGSPGFATNCEFVPPKPSYSKVF